MNSTKKVNKRNSVDNKYKCHVDLTVN